MAKLSKKLLLVALALVLVVSVALTAACDEKTYALTYAAGEGTGTAPEAEQIAAGTEVTLKANMFTAPEGKEFAGWLVEGETTAREAGSKITMPANAVTLTAQWKAKSEPQPTKYALTYDAGEGTGAAPAVEQVAEGAEVTLKANMFTAPEGKEFDGWLVDGAKKAAGDKISMPAKALTITAQWKTITPPQPAITAAANISIEHKGEATTGWLVLEADGEGSFYVADKDDEENILLYANITYTIDSEGELKIVSAFASDAESSPIVVPAVGSIVGHTVSITLQAAEGEAQYKFEGEVYKLRIEYGFEIEDGVSVTENYIPVGQVADFTDIEREGYTLTAIKANGEPVDMETAKEMAMPAMDVTFVYEWEEVQQPEKPTVTLYFYNADGWEIVNAHMWIDQGADLTSWPGKAMTAVDGHEGWMQITVEADLATQTLKVIFNNKVDNVGTQTDDLTAEAGKLYFTKNDGYESFAAVEEAIANAQKTTVYYYNSENWNEVYAYIFPNDPLGGWSGTAMTAVDGHTDWYELAIDATLFNGSKTIIFNNGNGAQTENLPIANATNLYYIYIAKGATAENYAYASFAEAEAAVAPPQPETFTVTFINGETVVKTVQVDKNATVAMPDETPVHPDGKTFRYWSDDSGEYNFATPVTGDITLTASFAYKVTFLAGEGATGTIEPKWITIWTPGSLALPDATGLSNGDKVFAGWSDGTDTYQAGERYYKAGLKNVTLTAQWNDAPDPDKYTLTFTVGGHGAGTPPAAIQLAEGETTTLPDGTGLYLSPDYQDEVFLGWGETWRGDPLLKAGSTYTMPAKNVSLQAIWGPAPVEPQEYTVTWIKSATESLLDSVVGNVPAAQQVLEGTTITAPAADTLTLAHYTLTSWRVYEFIIPTDGTDAYWGVIYENGQAVNIAPGAEYTMPGKNIQIKAVWTQNSVTVSFDANDGTGAMAPIQKNYNNYLNYSNIACTFTAPEGMQFAGWALSANGPVLTQDVKMSEIANEDDAVTLYAIWMTAAVVPATPLIDDIKGAWTSTGHTIDIIAGTDAENEYVKGYAVLDGEYYLIIIEDDGEYFAYSLDFALGYDITLSNETLTLTPYEGSAIALTGKTELTNAARSTFEGNWVKSGVAQKWIITADEVYYGVTDLKTASSSMIIGNYIVITYEQGSTATEKYIYTYILAKQGENLEGWWTAPGSSPVAATFVPGDYLTLIVDGKLNQVVTTGQAPDASKIIATAPEGKAFSKWVIAGTETEFDITAAMTESVAIEAIYVDSTTNVSKLYAGSVVVEYGSFTKKNYTIANFVINFETLEASCDDGTGWQLATTIQATNKTYMDTSVYGVDASYYELAIKATDNQTLALYLIVNADQTKITLCDSNDNPYDDGEYVLSNEPQTSPWADLATTNAKLAELCAAGTKLYFEEPISHESNSFLGIQFTTLGDSLAIQVLYVSNGAEKAGTTLATVVESGNMIRFKTGSGNYSGGTVLAMDANGDLYVTSLYFKSAYNTATKLVAQEA